MAQIKSLNCPNCGGNIPDTSKACSFCGSRVILSDDRQKFVLVGTICPKCGLDNKEQYRFCSKCGEKLLKECPGCHKEIGLDSIHCPFCGGNIDIFSKEREFELLIRKNSIKQLQLLREEINPFQIENLEILEQIYRITKYSDPLEGGPKMYVCTFYPLGALILYGFAYLLGFRGSFILGFILSYIVIFSIFYLLPSMLIKILENKKELLQEKIFEIQRKMNEYNQIISNLSKKYRI